MLAKVFRGRLAGSWEKAMMATPEEVKERLLKVLDGADVSGIREEDQQITGEVLWDGFKDQTVAERYRYVYQVLREPLGTRGFNIGTLFLLTPHEHSKWSIAT